MKVIMIENGNLYYKIVMHESSHLKKCQVEFDLKKYNHIFAIGLLNH